MSLNTMFAAYQKAEPTLSAAVKETRQKSMRDLQTQLQEKQQQQLAQQAQARQNELMAPIMEQVKRCSTTFGPRWLFDNHHR